MGSESANLVCSPFFTPGILRSQAGEYLCRSDRDGQSRKVGQSRKGEGRAGEEERLC